MGLGGRSLVRACAAVAAAAMVASGGCRATEVGPAGAAQACIADSIGALRTQPKVPACGAHDWLCRVRCFGGSAGSCLALAYAAEKNGADGADDAFRLYERACRLGSANACTNYAATVWARKHSTAQLACARLVFDRACAAKEPFACGMVGRLMLEDTTPVPVADARRHLESSCNAVGGFSCRVLAMHLEDGTFGDYPPERIPVLLEQACAGGDPDACGQPATASQTFRSSDRR